MSIDEQHVALPSLYGAPAYARPPGAGARQGPPVRPRRAPARGPPDRRGARSSPRRSRPAPTRPAGSTWTRGRRRIDGRAPAVAASRSFEHPGRSPDGSSAADGSGATRRRGRGGWTRTTDIRGISSAPLTDWATPPSEPRLPASPRRPRSGRPPRTRVDDLLAPALGQRALARQGGDPVRDLGLGDDRAQRRPEHRRVGRDERRVDADDEVEIAVGQPVADALGVAFGRVERMLGRDPALAGLALPGRPDLADRRRAGPARG